MFGGSAKNFRLWLFCVFGMSETRNPEAEMQGLVYFDILAELFSDRSDDIFNIKVNEACFVMHRIVHNSLMRNQNQAKILDLKVKR